MSFPDLTIVNGKHITLVDTEQLLEVAQSIGLELKRRSVQDHHHDASAALSMRLSGVSLVEAVRNIRNAGERIAGSEFSQWSRSRSLR